MKTRRGSFTPGQRWRIEKEKDSFAFVCLGRPERVEGMAASYPSRYVKCRIEVIGHGAEHGPECDVTCHHGLVQNYAHTYLKKIAKLVD